MSGDKVRLIVLDENAAVRRALALRLSRAQDLEIIGDTGNLVVAQELVNEHCPDVVIMECKRRDGAALRFCQHVLERPCKPAIVVLTSFANEDERLSLLHLGIKHYLLKDIQTDELIDVVRMQAKKVNGFRLHAATG